MGLRSFGWGFSSPNWREKHFNLARLGAWCMAWCMAWCTVMPEEERVVCVWLVATAALRWNFGTLEPCFPKPFPERE